MPSRQHRVTRGDEYRSIVRKGRRVGGAYCITHAVLRSPEDPARFGYIVTKAVGNAVTRNLLRRRLKGITEALLHDGLTGVDVVFRVLPASSDAPYARMADEVGRAVRRVVAERNQ
ncbi:MULTISPECIES: ribonuclease P protein component [unclassified Leucobacter]|uniref:ribonuclease P protein component n=1 Tax=unclassified Leucobacter TaxID=2621730 RepID=UPI00165E08FC|nr:ribonuclease P protein component [Leucobacter sp. CX169]MBC9926984.1 ribonuclease P protein component [Leucobacter sp. cx-169]